MIFLQQISKNKLLKAIRATIIPQFFYVRVNGDTITIQHRKDPLIVLNIVRGEYYWRIYDHNNYLPVKKALIELFSLRLDGHDIVFPKDLLCL